MGKRAFFEKAYSFFYFYFYYGPVCPSAAGG
jgi:hypothetical protein